MKVQGIVALWYVRVIFGEVGDFHNLIDNVELLELVVLLPKGD